MAIERFPQLRREITEADHAGWVWHELKYALQDAYREDAEGIRPLNENFVSNVYEYAHWCLHHRSIEIRTYVVVWFYEDVAADPMLCKGLGRWIAREDFDLLEFAWRYLFKDEEKVKAFQQDFKRQMADAQRTQRKSYWA